MAKHPPTPAELLSRLEVRHEELLHQLDELQASVEQVLHEFTHQDPTVGDDETRVDRR